MEIAAKMLISKTVVENVLLKLNVKAGGHNYGVTPEEYANALWTDRKTLIIGYDDWHPTGQSRAEKMAEVRSPPYVVGFSFNGGVNPDSFIGDYHYQEPRKERVEDAVLSVRIKWILGVYEKSRGGLPTLIVIVRDGISEGQYKYGMDELEVLRAGAKEYAVSPKRSEKTGKGPVEGYSPKFIFIIATKRHNRRAYANESRSNMPAMSVVDDTITHPALFEFFLQAQTPLKGMAKPTKYSVLKDDVGTSQDALQSLMGALCFEHQICSNAISIPEPVYQADEWAKRGAANFRTFKELYIDAGRYKASFTYEDLTRDLAYWNSTQEKVRVNA